MPRRQVLSTFGAAVLASPTLPARQEQGVVLPNKPEGVGANAGQYPSELRKKEYAAMAGDKGTRGVASKDFDKNDTVQLNCEKFGGGIYGADGKKKAAGTRNRGPEELGLKQWTGRAEALWRHDGMSTIFWGHSKRTIARR